MPEELPIACSLGAEDLAARLDLIAALGAENLISRSTEDGAHLLRFRRGEGVRRALESVVAAEAECCAFLDLAIREEPDALVLAIDAPAEGAPIAAELAAAFEGSSR